MSAHTPEPWIASKARGRDPGSKREFINVYSDETTFATIGLFYSGQTRELNEARANAERAVECVNGCVDIPKPGGIREVISAAISVIQNSAGDGADPIFDRLKTAIAETCFVIEPEAKP